MLDWIMESPDAKKGHDFNLPREVSSMTPKELLRIESVNGIPVEQLNKYLKPVREYVEDLYRVYGMVPDEEMLNRCTPGSEYQNRVWIDRGLIGPHDDIRQVLAFQRAFVDEVLRCEDPNKLIAGEMEKVFFAIKKFESGAGLIEFNGIAGKKMLYTHKFGTPVPAHSPFMDGDASNIHIRVYDVTGADKVDANLLKKCEKTGRTIMLSGLNIDFASKYGFYEEAETLLEYDSLLDGGKASIKNIFTFLPDGLTILGITNMDIEELRSRYAHFQEKYKKVKV
ncbi:MAG: hypothetical protein UW68_C0004G0011 [Candidatus Collierbacteria bacterium GW2011_GWB1_44_6]|uniref:Uncharacterized protein n=2 Tax=Candidatus Collieribacteriota TaxID=1752725 RepID=A0A0G1MNT0_9BACT|nr:MAG: hypothetical protein UV68_C0032G0006 [Candidatus Collierbacteria bacterium GW2011_GWC2_43_12]KKT73654.1 MAG: hypothetical protein UW68_C0004G0011 [Candidatus Collierbacteria bacterium GW2011_GWB1_44_6]KKT83568.1 MAG: hypothetical protein UW80_C0011G0016 [Microgenomates group bacterium GW2011_GWC1_44_9]